MILVSAEQGAASCCPRCNKPFERRRKDQRYCSKPCAKAATRNANRGSQKIADNAHARRLADLHRSRAFLLNDDLYRKHPADRPAFMESIIRAARDHDWHLRRILTDRRALLDFGTDYAGRPNLVRTLDDYCQRTRRARGWQVIDKDWQDPAEKVPLALYKDPWTDPDDGPDKPLPVLVRQDPVAFLNHLKALRAGTTRAAA